MALALFGAHIKKHGSATESDVFLKKKSNYLFKSFEEI